MVGRGRHFKNDKSTAIRNYVHSVIQWSQVSMAVLILQITNEGVLRNEGAIRYAPTTKNSQNAPKFKEPEVTRRRFIAGNQIPAQQGESDLHEGASDRNSLLGSPGQGQG